MIERAVDYIQASLSLSEQALIMRGYKPLPAIQFYKRGYQHPTGFRIYFGNPNSKKAIAIASGQAMESMRSLGKSDPEILDWILSEGGEISRIDLAVTEFVEDELLTIADVEKWFKLQLIESPLVSGGLKEISSISPEQEIARETIYIGNMQKRAKKGIFRAYDKGIELGLGSEIATRIELEIKREKAHSTAKRLAESGDIAGNFRAYFNVRSDDFNRVMDADAVAIHRGKNQVHIEESEEIERRWAWLMSQVAPALKSAVREERKHDSSDSRLIEFMIAAGIYSDAKQIALTLSDMKFRDKLIRNELQQIPKESE